MKKKIITIIVMLIMMITIGINVKGATSIADGKADRGEEVILQVKLSNTLKAKSGSIQISYDKDKMTLKEGNWTISNALLTNFDLTTELGAFAYMNATAISGVIFEFKFEISSTTAYGKYAVVVTVQVEDENSNKTEEKVTGYVIVGCSHSYSVKKVTEETKVKDATCTEGAKYYYTCSKCNEKGTSTFTQGSPLGHTGGSASCSKKAVCTRCNKEYGELLTHTYGEWKIVEQATEEKEGTKEKECITCGNKITEKIAILGHTHKYEEKILIESSCEKQGMKEFKCTCGDSYTELLDELTHEYTEYEILVDSTEYEVGYKQRKCVKCNNIELSEIEKKAHVHQYNEKYSYNKYSHYKECECGNKENESNHSLIIVEETNTKTVYKCNTCDYEKEEIIKEVPSEIEPVSITPYLTIIAVEAIIIISLLLVIAFKKKR